MASFVFTDRYIPIQTDVIRSVTIPNNTADCAVLLRRWFMQNERFPTVEELSKILGVSKSAVVQFQNKLRRRKLFNLR